MRFPFPSAIALVLAGAAAAQQPAVVACRACADTGKVVCGKHGRMLAQEQAPGTLHCSVATECKACAGALATDCAKCSNAAVEADLAQRQQLAREWLAKRREEIDAVTRREPYLHLATPHYELAFLLKPATIGKEKVDAHARMHLYGERLEALRTVFAQTLELTDADLPDRMTVAMSEEFKDHALLGPRLTGIGASNSVGLKWMGPQYVYSMWNDKRGLPDDEAVHRNIVHHVSHLLLSQMKPALFLGNKRHGWIDEGVAHWFEDKVVGKCTNFCFEEILMQSPATFKGGKWRQAVRQFVDEGKPVAFAALSDRNTDQLTYVEHTFAFAYVDFLLTDRGGAKFRDFLRLVKNDQATRDALQQVYGLSPLSIDAVFLPWVKEHYSPLVPR
jgi:hypothetical protein